MNSRRDQLSRALPGAVTSGPRERKALHKLIDKYLGEDAEDCIAVLAGVIKGTEPIKIRSPGKDEDAVSYALVPEAPPSVREKLEAIKLVLSYRHGMPKESIEHSGFISPGMGAAQPLALDYSQLSDGELARMEELTQKALSERRIVTVDVQPEPKKAG